MNGIYWLASYPKSGNTWLRVFLTNYRRNGDEPADINTLDGAGIGFSREGFDEWVGVESSNLTQKQIEHYRPLVYEQMAAESPETLFLKVHDAFTCNSDGQPIFSKKATVGVIYLIRNPLDVAISYASHRDESIDETIIHMGCHEAMMAGSDKPGGQLPQKLTSWSNHVSSWAKAPGLNVHIVRYEDMLQKPFEIFTEILRFAGLGIEAERVKKAVEFSCFERLQAQEKSCGFVEKQPTSACFFRQGQAGSWREKLTDIQVQRLIYDHREIMCRFGYLTSGGEILF